MGAIGTFNNINSVRALSYITSDGIILRARKRTKEFDLIVGDYIQIPSTIYGDGSTSLSSSLTSPRALNANRVGRVIGIYPHIFHVELLGNAHFHRLESFQKKDYQLGEVIKLER